MIFEVKVQTVSERIVTIEAPSRAVALYNAKWRFMKEEEEIVNIKSSESTDVDMSVETWKVVDDIYLDVLCNHVCVSYVGDNVEKPWMASVVVMDIPIVIRSDSCKKNVIAKAITNDILNKFKVRNLVEVDEIAKIYDTVYEKTWFDSTAEAQMQKEENDALNELLI